MRYLSNLTFMITMSLIFSSPVYAYIGPGLGAGTIAVIFGFIMSIFLAVFAVFWYPVKRLLIKLGVLKKSGDKKTEVKRPV